MFVSIILLRDLYLLFNLCDACSLLINTNQKWQLQSPWRKTPLGHLIALTQITAWGGRKLNQDWTARAPLTSCHTLSLSFHSCFTAGNGAKPVPDYYAKSWEGREGKELLMGGGLNYWQEEQNSVIHRPCARPPMCTHVHQCVCKHDPCSYSSGNWREWFQLSVSRLLELKEWRWDWRLVLVVKLHLCCLLSQV